MSDVSFNEENSMARPGLATRQPIFVRWLLASKIVTTQRQAEYVLIAIGVSALLLAVLMWPSGRSQPKNVVEIAAPPGVVPGERAR